MVSILTCYINTKFGTTSARFFSSYVSIEDIMNSPYLTQGKVEGSQSHQLQDVERDR